MRPVYQCWTITSFTMLKVHKAAVMADVGSHVCKLSARCSRGLRTQVTKFCKKGEETTIAGIPYKNLSIGVPKELFAVSF